MTGWWTMSIADLRKDYTYGGLNEDEVDPNPVEQFARWLAEAMAGNDPEPHAMTVATASAHGEPSARMILLKAFDERGFVFYTNYASQKGRDLIENPRAALLFFWAGLERQVRISGAVEQLPREESAAYFRSRPRASQIGSSVSRQSSVIPSRTALEAELAWFAAEHEGREIAPPAHWGGFRVIPATFEFWQGRPNRLHDRLRYTKQPDGGWRIERLAP